MKIAFFSDTYIPQVNGIALSLSLLKERLLELGHQITIFAPQADNFDDGSDKIVRIKSFRVRENPPFYVGSPLSPSMYRLLRHRSFDLIHVHTPLTMGLLAYQASHILQVPLVYTYHTIISEYSHYIGWFSKTTLARQTLNSFDLFFCNLCDVVIAPSLKIKKMLEGNDVSTLIENVPNGVRLDQFQKTDNNYLQTHSNIKDTDRILLFVGRLGQEKNPSFLIKALARLLKKTQDVKLVFAGSGYLIKELRCLTEELGIAHSVIFLGNVPYDDIAGLYTNADVFVSASTSEVHPMTLLEAIASGLPVVAVYDDAFESAVVNGRNGFFTARNEQLFADRLFEILENSAMRELMSKESLKISKGFSLEKQVSRLLDTYSGLILNSDRR